MEKMKLDKSYFEVLGICCSSEVPLVEKILKPLEGVSDVTVIIPSRTVIVRHDSLLISQLQIANALNKSGLEASIKVKGNKNNKRKRKNIWTILFAVASAMLLLTSLVLQHTYHPLGLLRFLPLVAVALHILPILRKAYAAIRNFSFANINILVLITVAGSIALKDYLEAGTIVLLFTVAQWLESNASHRATAAMSSLADIVPQTAVIAETGERVNADQVKLNTILAIKPGDVIPIDGLVVQGNCDVDEKTLTGESFPVSKQIDSTVWAGTINLNGYVSVNTTALAEDCVVARMANLVEEAQNNKSKTQRTIDRCMKYYTPIIIAISLALVIIPSAVRAHNLSEWYRLALVVLVSACPCALVLSTPVAAFCALSNAAKSGLLVKGAEHLETLAKVKIIAFDKTGTITKGEFVVVDFKPLLQDDHISLQKLLYWVASIESKSSHPMAEALVEYAKSYSVEPRPDKVEDFHNFPGEGICGNIDGKDIYVGNKKIAIRAGCATFAFAGISTAAGHTGNETDRLALLAFKYGIKQDPYGFLKSWNESQHFCQWHGVTCGSLHQRVTALDLGSSKLTGSISPFIGNLSFLRILNLENNSFSHAIPPQISSLRRIKHLWLHNNSLVGNIPSNLSACSNLITFRVEKNKLDGVIPVELGSVSKLKILRIGDNELTGGIPISFGNMSSLSTLYLTSNNLTGSIPSTLGRLTNLVIFDMAGNMLSGTIPSDIFNLSSITGFDVQMNQLQGVLPSYLGNTFTKLNFFGISFNKFTGSIPLSLSNASELIYFEASYNNLTGEIPKFINSGKLFRLWLRGNQLGHGGKFDDLSFFPSLTNCTDLDSLDFGGNNLGGIFPKSFLNLSTTLRQFSVDNNHISGSIPSGIERFVNLDMFVLSNNRIIGTIPPDIGKLQNLEVLDLIQNHLSGNIPSSLGNLSRLFIVYLADNHLKGNIPSSLGNCQSLNQLDLSGNNINGPIPLQIFGISSLNVLSYLDLSENRLTGSLPTEVEKLKNLRVLHIYNNMLSGNIPSTLASCVLLEELDMQGNLFQGKIPSSFSALRGLQFLNLASNNISGAIPDFFGEFELQYLNLSFNDFEGELPNKGIFKNASAIFVNGNTRLCGGVPELKLPVCISSGSKKKSRPSTYKLIVFTILGVLGLTLMFCLLLFCGLKRKRPQQTLESSDHVHFRVSYQALRAATDRFSSANMIGSGGFRSVYRGNLEDGRLIAVKVLNLEHRAAAKSFIVECEALRNIRHRNLVKLLTVCSGIDYQGNNFKAVVYEFMVNGNLDEWLHPVPTEDTHQQRHNMNLLARLSIAIDVATALNYLHNDCQPPIVHCDIKPSNILLDNEMTAHVGDFGLARFIIERDNNDAIQTSTGGVRESIGYTPPEYGLGSEMSTMGDVYSFGILLLEMMTAKRPTDSTFQEGHNLHHFAQMSLPNKVRDIVDNVLLQDNEECLISAVKIGVACSLEYPKDRMRISDVLRELNVLKALFLSGHN